MSTCASLDAAAIEEKDLIDILLQSYLRELRQSSEKPSAPCSSPYPWLEAYWTTEGIEDGRAPFLIRVNGDLAGFAFRTSRSHFNFVGPTSTVAEFFILPEYRRRRVGQRAARTVFDHYPGRWEVVQLRENIAAQRFWRAVITATTNGAFEEHDVRSEKWNGPVQVFRTPDTTSQR